MHPRVAVHEFSTGALGFDEELRLWAGLGVTSVGLVPAKLHSVGWDTVTDALKDGGLRVSSMFGGTFFDLADPDSWATSQAELAATLERSAAIDVGCVYIVPGRAGGFPWEQLFDRFSAAVAPSVARSSELGIRLAFEPWPQVRTDISFVSQLTDAVDVAEATGLGIVVDFAACWMQRGLAQRFSEARDHIALVQVSDFAIGSLVSPDRRVPGDGDLPVRSLLEQLLGVGYDGPFELEVFGPAIDEEGVELALGRAANRLSDMLNAIGA